MDFSKLDRYMDLTPELGVPACELAVTLGGKLVYRRSVGYSDAAGTKPACGNDLYWIFSASKVITCALAMKLVEEGKIALDDPVSKYIPAFANVSVRRPDGSVAPAQNEMKIVHLFNMTGGLDYELFTPNITEAVKKYNGRTFDVVSAMAESPLHFEPGTHYSYSLCHDVLAAVIEVASGERLSDYVRKNLTDPLEMTDTGFVPTEEQKSRFSAMYRYRNGLARSVEVPINNLFRLGGEYESGGAGFFSKPDDYIKFITALANGGVAENGYRLLKSETVEMMTKNYLCDDALDDFAPTKFFGYGWGLCGRVHMNPALSGSRSPVGEFGWDGAACSYVLVDTTNNLAIFFATHIQNCSFGHHKLHPTIRDLVYDGIER